LSILTGLVAVIGLAGCSQPATEPAAPPSVPSSSQAPTPPTTSASSDPHGARACRLIREARARGAGEDVSAVKEVVREAGQSNDGSLRISATYLRARVNDVVDFTGQPDHQEWIDALKRAGDAFLQTCDRSRL
jgi:hypothetical protein